LEAYEAVDEETPTCRTGKTVLHSDKVGKDDGRKRYNARIEDERDDGESHV